MERTEVQKFSVMLELCTSSSTHAQTDTSWQAIASALINRLRPQIRAITRDLHGSINLNRTTTTTAGKRGQ